jgi:hypothetical protein
MTASTPKPDTLTPCAAKTVWGLLRAPALLLEELAERTDAADSYWLLGAAATSLKEAGEQLSEHAHENDGTDGLAYNTASAAATAAFHLCDVAVVAHRAGRLPEVRTHTAAAYDLISFMEQFVFTVDRAAGENFNPGEAA